MDWKNNHKTQGALGRIPSALKKISLFFYVNFVSLVNLKVNTNEDIADILTYNWLHD